MTEIIIAARDSDPTLQALANYVCVGHNDQDIWRTALTEKPCGVHWLLDLRWILVAVVVLVGLVVAVTRYMR